MKQAKSYSPMGRRKQRSVGSYFQKPEPQNALIKKVYNQPLVGGPVKNFNKKRASDFVRRKHNTIEPDLTSEFEQKNSQRPLLREDLENSLPALPFCVFSPHVSKQYGKYPQPPQTSLVREGGIISSVISSARSEVLALISAEAVDN